MEFWSKFGGFLWSQVNFWGEFVEFCVSQVRLEGSQVRILGIQDEVWVDLGGCKVDFRGHR